MGELCGSGQLTFVGEFRPATTFENKNKNMTQHTTKLEKKVVRVLTYSGNADRVNRTLANSMPDGEHSMGGDLTITVQTTLETIWEVK